MSEIIRDRKVLTLAKQARSVGQPVEVMVNLIPIKRKTARGEEDVVYLLIKSGREGG